jgi:hypothetical protein
MEFVKKFLPDHRAWGIRKGVRDRGSARIEVGGSLRFDFAHLRLRLEAKDLLV